MDHQTQEFQLRLRSKLNIVILFAFVGIPMLYAAYLNYQVQEFLFSSLMILLFFTWAVVILVATGFKIKLTEKTIHREGLFSPSVIEFSEIDTIHFGSAWSNFYVEADGKKIFFGKDFEDYETLFQQLINRVKNIKNIEEIRFMGDPENIQEYAKVNG